MPAVHLQIPHAAHKVPRPDREALGQVRYPAQQQGPGQIQRLFAATLGALGSTGVVAQDSSETQGHPRVTAIHGHHSYLLLRWALREPRLT